MGHYIRHLEASRKPMIQLGGRFIYNILTDSGKPMTLQVVRLLKCIGTKHIVKSEKTEWYTHVLCTKCRTKLQHKYCC
jgi:hypothetical protein